MPLLSYSFSHFEHNGAQKCFALFDQLFVGKSVSVDVGFDAYYYLFLERGLLKNQGEQIGLFSKGFGN